MEKTYFKIKGIITDISNLKQVERRGVPDLFKKTLTIETLDGHILFPEIRNKRIKQLEVENIKAKDMVEIEIAFEGSEKNGKKYNNIYCYSITKTRL